MGGVEADVASFGLQGLGYMANLGASPEPESSHVRSPCAVSRLISCADSSHVPPCRTFLRSTDVLDRARPWLLIFYLVLSETLAVPLICHLHRLDDWWRRLWLYQVRVRGRNLRCRSAGALLLHLCRLASTGEARLCYSVLGFL